MGDVLMVQASISMFVRIVPPYPSSYENVPCTHWTLLTRSGPSGAWASRGEGSC